MITPQTAGGAYMPPSGMCAAQGCNRAGQRVAQSLAFQRLCGPSLFVMRGDAPPRVAHTCRSLACVRSGRRRYTLATGKWVLTDENPTVIPLCGTDRLRLPAHIAKGAMYAPPAKAFVVQRPAIRHRQLSRPATVQETRSP